MVTYTAILDIYAKAAAQGLEGDWVNLSLQILQVPLTKKKKTFSMPLTKPLVCR